MAQAVAARDEGWQAAYEALSPEARERWGLEQVKTIRNTVARDLTPAEFQMGLALAAHYNLDPLLKEIWFVKGKARDGSPGQTLIMAGRDGFLKVARARPDFRGIDCDVVRENDDFRVTRAADGSRTVEHSYEGGPAKRGKILGAWCIATFDGKIPFYYFADLDEYMPKSEPKIKYSPWGSQVSVMILKCAQSYCLRMACGISGMVGAEESDRAFEAQAAEEVHTGTSLADVANAIADPDLRDRFYAAYGAAADRGLAGLAAAEMNLAGQPSERQWAYVMRLEQENAQAAACDGEPTDAEVVSEDESADFSEGGTAANGTSDPPPASPGSAPLAEGPSPEVDEVRVEILTARLGSLLDQRADAADQDDFERVAALEEEIEIVEDQLTAAGGTLPGRSS